MSADFSSLVPVLSALLDRAGTSPIQLDVSIRDSDEVKELRAEVAILKERVRRAEYNYSLEASVTNQVLDYCSQNNIDIPKHLYQIQQRRDPIPGSDTGQS